MRTPVRVLTTALVVGALTSTIVTAAQADDRDHEQPTSHSGEVTAPTILGHRGAAGYRPEHTAIGYELAAEMGADFLEPELVPTKDGYLVDRHEPDITGTTDVASHPEFASLKTTKTVDGVTTTGWFTTDFTLAQLETLGAVEALSARLHRTIGIVPEIKHSTYFRSAGLPMEDRVLAVLRSNHLGGLHPRIPTILQSFEVGNLLYVHGLAPDLPLMQLTSASGAPADFVAAHSSRTYADLVSPQGLREVARYATYLGTDKNQIVPRTATNALGAPTTLVHDAHAAGLLVTPYTFRNENQFLPTDFQRGVAPGDYGNAIAEYELFFSVGVDGMFSDDSDTAVLARRLWIEAGRPHQG